MDERINGRKISTFYRFLSPIGAAALPRPMKTKEKVEQGKGTADHLQLVFVGCDVGCGVCCSSWSTASWRLLEEVLLFDKYSFYHLK